MNGKTEERIETSYSSEGIFAIYCRGFECWCEIKFEKKTFIIKFIRMKSLKQWKK